MSDSDENQLSNISENRDFNVSQDRINESDSMPISQRSFQNEKIDIARPFERSQSPSIEGPENLFSQSQIENVYYYFLLMFFLYTLFVILYII